MPDDSMTQTPQRDQATAKPNRSAPVASAVDEGVQPDPALQMTTGRAGPVGITLLAVVAALILAVFFYGLNSGGTTQHTAAAPAAPPAPSAAQSGKPAAGGKPGPAVPTAPRANASGVKD
jgi:hypothetical protein